MYHPYVPIALDHEERCVGCGRTKESELSHFWKCESCGMVGNGENTHPCTLNYAKDGLEGMF